MLWRHKYLSLDNIATYKKVLLWPTEGIFLCSVCNLITTKCTNIHYLRNTQKYLFKVKYELQKWIEDDSKYRWWKRINRYSITLIKINWNLRSSRQINARPMYISVCQYAYVSPLIFVEAYETTLLYVCLCIPPFLNFLCISCHIKGKKVINSSQNLLCILRNYPAVHVPLMFFFFYSPPCITGNHVISSSQNFFSQTHTHSCLIWKPTMVFTESLRSLKHSHI
jgi:hypothetical protein